MLGGSGAIGDGVLRALRAYATSGKVTRLSGADRYATAAAISASSWDAGEPSTVYLVTGTGFADALAAAALAGVTNSPLLTTVPTYLSDAAGGEIDRLSPSTVVLLGGSGALSDAVFAEVRSLLYGG